MTDFIECPSGGEHGDEPSYTTINGYPVCAKCGNSTRNRNQIICAPCRNRTRLVLTEKDREFFQQIGISI